jgi:hypothetical protein
VKPGTVSSYAARVTAAVFGAAMVAGLVVGAVGPPSWRTAMTTSGPACPFRTMTGVDCPFCGMTRATLALGEGHWHDALALHPLAPLVLIGIGILLAIIVFGSADVLVRGRRPLLLLAAIVILWILRLSL